MSWSLFLLAGVCFFGPQIDSLQNVMYHQDEIAFICFLVGTIVFALENIKTAIDKERAIHEYISDAFIEAVIHKTVKHLASLNNAKKNPPPPDTPSK